MKLCYISWEQMFILKNQVEESYCIIFFGNEGNINLIN